MITIYSFDAQYIGHPVYITMYPDCDFSILGSVYLVTLYQFTTKYAPKHMLNDLFLLVIKVSLSTLVASFLPHGSTVGWIISMPPVEWHMKKIYGHVDFYKRLIFPTTDWQLKAPEALDCSYSIGGFFFRQKGFPWWLLIN